MIPVLLIRADAGPQIGMGHVMRCLALAEPWLQAGSAVTVLTASPFAALRSRAVALGVAVQELTAPPGSAADAAQTIALAQSLRARWLVLDGYHFDAAYQRAVKASDLHLLVFDDTAHAAHYSADFILNQNLGASASLYAHREPTTRLLLGTRFVQLRGEFTPRLRQPDRSAEQCSALRLLVTLGGSDPDNVTGEVLAALQTIPGITADIIIGPTNPHGEVLASSIQHSASSIRLHRNPPDLPDLMARADLAICAGGTTAWELCFLGVPLLVLVLAENQRSNAEQLAQAGVALHANVAELADRLGPLLADAPRRAEMSRRARALVDGLGAFRVWLRMNEGSLHLRPATADDCRRVWEWASEPAVRAVSFSSEPIPWEAHVAWFSRQLVEVNTRLWIAEQAGAPGSDPAGTAAAPLNAGSENGAPAALGQVRFTLEGSIATIGVSLDASHRGRNLGALLIWSACRRLFRELAVQVIHAFIKPDNAASIRAFEKAGFTATGETVIKGCPALKFSLGREPEA